MISHELKTVFIHMPKTAGTSILTYLHTFPHEERRQWGHHFLRSYRPYIHDYYVWCMVRNPWDRVVSAYEYIKRGGINAADCRLRDRLNLENLSFEEFITGPMFQVAQGRLVRPQHFIQQRVFLQNMSSHVNFVGKFENLQAHFDMVCDAINIPRYNLPKINGTKHADYRTYYNKRTSKIVRKAYRKDIKIFGYEFDSFDPEPIINTGDNLRIG